MTNDVSFDVSISCSSVKSEDNKNYDTLYVDVSWKTIIHRQYELYIEYGLDDTIQTKHKFKNDRKRKFGPIQLDARWNKDYFLIHIKDDQGKIVSYEMKNGYTLSMDDIFNGNEDEIIQLSRVLF